MSIVSSRLKTQRLLSMLRQHQCFNARQAAVKLNCTARNVKHYLARLRQDGYLIHYDRKLRYYVLEEGGEEIMANRQYSTIK